jgi:hypothetical protein
MSELENAGEKGYCFMYLLIFFFLFFVLLIYVYQRNFAALGY